MIGKWKWNFLREAKDLMGGERDRKQEGRAQGEEYA